MTSFRFLSRYRLKKQNDFRRVFERRRSVSDGRLIVYGCENGLPHPRLGMSVSRKLGQATHRNRLRRLIREAFRLTRPELPTGIDFVVIPRGPEEHSLEAFKESLKTLTSQVARRLARDVKRHDSPAQESDRSNR